MTARQILRSAARNLFLHKFRSCLTVLGILFGISSVICMLSVSAVAKKEALAQIELLGVNNIIVNSIRPKGTEAAGTTETQGNSAEAVRYGLRFDEVESFRKNIPTVKRAVPFRLISEEACHRDRRLEVQVAGTTADYPETFRHHVQSGRFFRPDEDVARAGVCVLGSEVKERLFPREDAVGESIRIGGDYYTVAGVLASKGFKGGGAVQIENPDRLIFIPYQVSKGRFSSMQTKVSETGAASRTHVEVDRLILQTAKIADLTTTRKVAANLLKRGHPLGDYEIILPNELLEQHRKTQRLFAIVMTSIAAISLLVGGIGIMNSMIATVAERRPEIGIRRALGSTRKGIFLLFLAESVLMCVGGGLLGVGTGTAFSHVVAWAASWEVEVQPVFVMLGVSVSAVVGLLFGTIPARRAARLDTVEILRGT